MDAWEIKSNDNRTADSLYTFIIFCEDEVSEIDYFRTFETEFIKINAIGKQKSKSINVNRAIVHCLKEGFIKKDGTPNFGGTGIQVWCVFDRDGTVPQDTKTDGDYDFDSSIRWAQNNGLNVAWSNDAFELWILLHFEDVIFDSEEVKHRSYYYQRLSNIFNSIETQNPDLLRIRAFPMPIEYKAQLKSKKLFRKIVLPHILQKTDDAIERAKTLELNHQSDPPKSYSEIAPCTLIYRLVEELIRLGKGTEVA